MLTEYGLTPDILATSTYSSPEVCDLLLKLLKEKLLQQGLVRDFRGGEWKNHIGTHIEKWDKRAKELFRKLVDQKRLIGSLPALPHSPGNDAEWCLEALASHRSNPLTGIIASAETAAHFKAENVVGSIARLDASAWWQADRQSLRLKRNTSEYLTHLDLILKHANLLMFIDPNLDPTKKHYAEFVKLLLATKRADFCPARIQIHRRCYEGSRQCGDIKDDKSWREIFEVLHQPLARAGVAAEVFIWDDLHDRYLVTDLIGISLPYGFDISKNSNQMTTWSRITRADREDVQREFDHPSTTLHELHCMFMIGER